MWSGQSHPEAYQPIITQALALANSTPIPAASDPQVTADRGASRGMYSFVHTSIHIFIHFFGCTVYLFRAFGLCHKYQHLKG